jgi:ribokinase
MDEDRSDVVEVVVVGSANLDLAVRLDRLPDRGETVLAGPVERGPGGKGLNQAVASARLGRRTAFLGAVGDDDAARALDAFLAGEGVRRVLRRTATATGHALVLLDGGGESTIVVSPGANGALTAADVARHADLLSDARAVLAQLEIPVPSVTQALRHAGGLRVLNPAPGRALPVDLLAAVDVLVPNRHELALLVGRRALDRLDDVAAAARQVAGPRTVVVTLGADGALVLDRGRAEHVPSVPVAVVDATGAGDTFCAALVDALVDDADPVEAARWAVRAAAVTVTRPGAARAMPHRSDVAAPA